MAFDLTKITAALTGLTNWARAGFSNHNVRITNLENNSANLLVGRFVSSQAEQDATMNAAPNQQTVFNSWYRFSHDSTGVQPANTGELSAWAYDSGSGAISNTTNSVTFIGVVSQESYDEYILDVKIRSTNTDDDMIGLLLAWYKDPATGKEYTLSALRSPGGGSWLYAVVYNAFQGALGSMRTVQDGSASVKWGNGQPGTLSATAAGYVTNTTTTGWSGQATTYGTDGHIRLYVKRAGDIITVQTSDWADPDTLIPSSLLTIDLTSSPDLAKFRGPAPYGFVADSQQNSLWSVSQFTNPQDVIYNLATGNVYENVNGTWTLTTAESVAGLGTDVLLVNPDTNKAFFMKDPTNITVFSTTKLGS